MIMKNNVLNFEFFSLQVSVHCFIINHMNWHRVSNYRNYILPKSIVCNMSSSIQFVQWTVVFPFLFIRLTNILVSHFNKRALWLTKSMSRSALRSLPLLLQRCLAHFRSFTWTIHAPNQAWLTNKPSSCLFN